MLEEPLVFLVDDDPVTHQIVRTNVESLGYAFNGLLSGSNFIETVLENQPVLILLDINLPGINGFDLCTRLQNNPHTATIPVLFLTVLDSPDSIDEAFRRGAVDYITKPFRNEELRARIRAQVTLQVTLRRLEREIQIKQKLFSLISHDLRSPFTSMIGVMQLLLTEYSSMNDSDRQEFLQALLDNSLQHLQLLDNLMYWSRGQSDRILVSLNQLPLAALVQSVFESLQPMAAAKKIKLFFEIPIDLRVLADSELTKVILKNLVHNSIKFCLAQGLVQVYIAPELNRGGMLSLMVEDNGQGMDELRQSQVFVGFDSVPGTAGEKGAGIGLNISQALAQCQGGFLRILKSDPGGTVMGLVLQPIPS